MASVPNYGTVPKALEGSIAERPTVKCIGLLVWMSRSQALAG